MIADPGHRQVSKGLVGLAQAVKGDRIGRRRNAAPPGQHDALGAARGTGCVEDDRWSRPLASLDFPIKPRCELGVTAKRVAALTDDIVDRMQMAVVVVPQPACFIIKDLGEPRDAPGNRLDFVDLLLVLCDRQFHLGVD